MWIQIRTIDGKETRTIEDLSRLTKIECLRLKIKDIFNVNPEHQRLFYRGKQMEDGQTLFDYNVGLNDIVQLLTRSHADPPDSPTPKDYEVAACSSASPAAVTPASNGAKSFSQSLDNQPSTSNRSFLIHPGIGAFKINELVDCRDISIGAWFEASIENVSRASKGQNGQAPALGKSGKPSKRTNGKLGLDQRRSAMDSRGNAVLNSDCGPSTSHTDCADSEEVIYHIKYDE